MRFFLGLAMVGLVAGSARAQQKMAITFDDLPVHGAMGPGVTRIGIAESILKTLKDEKMPPAYGFINGVETMRDKKTMAVLQTWRAAGEPLANHGWMHLDLNAVSAVGYEANIGKNDALLKQLMGEPDSDWKWYRYPYLHEGGTLEKRRSVRAWLSAHSYRVAEVNMDFEDSLWNDPYARCMVKHNDKAIARLHDTYLATADEYVGVFRTLAQKLYGRDVPYVLLLHIGAFDAKMLPELLELYRKRGFTFVSLQEAESDPAYKDDPDAASVGGGAQLEQIADKKGLDYSEPTKPYKMLDRICR